MKEQLKSTLENSRNYTLRVAELMPANLYTYKPEGAGWNFGELLHHIAYGMDWWKDNYMLGKKTDWDQPEGDTSKKVITAELTKAYDALSKAIEKHPTDEKFVQGFHATLDHITHHRGQAALHLRCAGATPPDYVY